MCSGAGSDIFVPDKTNLTYLGTVMPMTSQLREKLDAQIPVIGTWNTLSAPLATEVMALAGFDFQIIDLEHGPFGLGQIHQHVSACNGSGSCALLVRIPANEAWMALQALDQGAQGIVVPHISDEHAAADLATAIRYHPDGCRGFSPFTKAGGFTNRDGHDHAARSNASVVGVAIVESLGGLSVAGEIAGVTGIDVVYFGAYDISQALGHPGEPKHPAVIEAIADGVERVRSAGCCAGGFVPQNRDDVIWLLELGMGFVTYDVDSSILFREVAETTEWFDAETQG